MQWIVRSLKEGGTAIAIVPDGLLNQKPMLEFIKKECIVKAIISLPIRTFYATPKKTYILSVSRKKEGEQENPVFTYLVSETGETRDANRWVIQENNLDEAVSLYNQFKGSPSTFKSTSTRCKVVPWSDFNKYEHWMLDRLCWAPDELLDLGVEEEPEDDYTIIQFNELLKSTGSSSIKPWDAGEAGSKFKEVFLGDKTLFKLQIGKRVLKRNCIEDGVPCISANVQDVFGYIAESKLIEDFDVPSLTWGIDGNFDWSLIPSGLPFHPTDHCGVLRVMHENIDAEYLYHALRATRRRHGFDRTYRANLENVARVSVEIPIREDEAFDIQKQWEIAATYREIEEKKKQARDILRKLADARVSFL